MVANSKIPQIEKELEKDENKHLKALKPIHHGESEEDEDWLDPLYHESRATVSIKCYSIKYQPGYLE